MLIFCRWSFDVSPPPFSFLSLLLREPFLRLPPTQKNLSLPFRSFDQTTPECIADFLSSSTTQETPLFFIDRFFFPPVSSGTGDIILTTVRLQGAILFGLFLHVFNCAMTCFILPFLFLINDN